MAAVSPPALSALRRQLDAIDDSLHDLLLARSEVVAQVGALRAKGPVAVRPGREAAIIRRLLARNRPPLRPELLVRVWRDLLNGFSAQQQALRLAVPDPALAAVARAHFGPDPQLVAAGTAAAAIAAVAEGRAEVAVLPWPADWWVALARERRAHVVARLPFWAAPGAPDALVVTAAEPDPSGADRTLVAAAMDAERWRRCLGEPGPAAAAAEGWALADLAGFRTADRLPPEAVIVGAYALPLGHPA